MYAYGSEEKIKELTQVRETDSLDDVAKRLEEALGIAERNFIVYPLDSFEENAERIRSKLDAYDRIIGVYKKLISDYKLNVPDDVKGMLGFDDKGSISPEQLYVKIRALGVCLNI
ncbi:MAG: hypothetical protein AABX90_01370 [Nanoarchaeota archaeon]